jgi:hypothetical protein
MDYLDQLRTQQTRFFENHKDLNCREYTEYELQAIALACDVSDNWVPDILWPFLEVNLVAGQVRRVNTTVLLGSVKMGHYVIRVAAYTDSQTWMMRSHIILRNGGNIKKKSETADHIDPSRPFDDRLENIRWASKSLQSLNRRPFVMNKGKQQVECSVHSDFREIFKTFKDIDDASSSLGVVRSTLLHFMSKKIPKNYRGLYWRTKVTQADVNETWVRLKRIDGEELASEILVSDKGRIDTLKSVSSDGRKNPRSISSGSLNKVDGYMIKPLKLKNGRRKLFKVHKAVCEAFHGPKPSKQHTVDHKNRIRNDNTAPNLRWASREEQTSNRKRN